MYRLVLLIAGILCIVLGIYLLTRKTAATPEPVATVQPALTPRDEIPGWKMVDSGQINIDEQWTFVGEYSGRILVSMSGSAILDPQRPQIGPDGISALAPEGFTVPGIPQYCSLAKTDKGIQKVGVYRELEIKGKLYLGPNEDAAGLHGKSFADNVGRWSYRIYTK